MNRVEQMNNLRPPNRAAECKAQLQAEELKAKRDADEKLRNEFALAIVSGLCATAADELLGPDDITGDRLQATAAKVWLLADELVRSKP